MRVQARISIVLILLISSVISVEELTRNRDRDEPNKVKISPVNQPKDEKIREKHYKNDINDEKFVEELIIRPLADGKVLNHFQFTTLADWPHSSDPSSAQHFALLPKSMGQMTKRFEVEELHLSFTQGRWLNSQWGSSILSAPPGVELWTWFNSNPLQSKHLNFTQEERIEDLWHGLTYSMGGLFCTSLEQLKTTTTSSPHLSFGPEGNVKNGEDRSLLRYGTLPREAVCTENLTPWLKLLPCGSKSGIGALINPLKLYDVHWHSLGLHVRKIGQGANAKMELSQTLTVVVDPKSSTFSFGSLLAAQKIVACPLAHKSLVVVESNGRELQLSPTFTKSNGTYVYDLIELKTLELKIEDKTERNVRYKHLHESQLEVSRYLTGHGQEFGGITVEFKNTGEETLTLTYLEMLPWYLRVYFHSMRFYQNGEELDANQAFLSFHLVPAEVRKSTNLLEFVVEIPANATQRLTLQFEKAFLHWTEFPPDANRGFDLGSAVVTVSSSSRSHKRSEGESFRPSTERVYTEAMLVHLPTPDFSMPYNVVTLTGTVFALFFGSMFNLLIRRLSTMTKSNNEYVSNRPIARILRLFLSLVDFTEPDPEEKDE